MDTTKNSNAQPVLPRDVERNYVAAVAQMVISPQQAAYNKLRDELVANAPDVGYYDVKQLRALTHAERAVIVEANPDALNSMTVEPDEIATVLRGDLDARIWVASLTEGILRKWLFDDVCAEVERNSEIVRQDALDPYQRRGDAS